MIDISTKTKEAILAERDARKEALAKAKEDRELDDLRVLNDLEIEHGDDNVRAVYSSAGMVVIGRPKPGPMQRWREAMWSEKIKPGERAAAKARAAADLAKTCIIHPTMEAYSEMCSVLTGLGDTVGAAAVKFAGIVEEDEGKG